MNKDEHNKAYRALQQEEPIEPPPELDATILAESRRAVSAKPVAINKKERSHLTLRWTAPFATAALVVLSVSVYLLQPDIDHHHQIDTLYETAPSSPSAYKKKEQATDLMHQEGDAVWLEMDSMEESLADHVLADEYMPIEQEPSRLEAAREKKAATAPSRKMTVVARSRQQEQRIAEKPVASLSIADSYTDAEVFAKEQTDSLDSIGSAAAEASSDFSSASGASADSHTRSAAFAPAPVLLEPETRIKKIKTLIEKDQLEEAEKEFKRFEKAYPKHAFVKEYSRLLEALTKK